ncbi:neutral amino acid transporter 9-like [Lineus longissimus]|uniref:neutral amino acid transporter 9-like n=1 Tax=Lineus longissimus TaxID=88925 RepID=UPI002B4DC8E8
MSTSESPNSSVTSETSPLVRNPSASVSSLGSSIGGRGPDGKIRRPLQYHSINPTTEHRVIQQNHGDQEQASIHRYKYYSKLAPHQESRLLMPDHIVPSAYFLILPVKPAKGQQSSIITIFSIWNTLMGTSILSMPWAIAEAGFGLGICLLLFMCGLSLYTAYRVMKSPEGLDIEVVEFSDVCRYYLGKWGEVASVFFSLFALLGAMIVYWVLMSNFLYNSVVFIYHDVTNTSLPISVGNATPYEDAFCINGNITDPTTPPPTIPPHTTEVVVEILQSSYDTFTKWWSMTDTVPFYLILVLGPLINFRSPTFFAKFNSLGTLSVLYLLIFVVVKSVRWGIHLDFDATDLINNVPMYRPSFAALTGTLSLALFIHNCILSMVRNQKHPENNGRDLSIAYLLVTVTYAFVGIMFYAAFPFAKSCIEDNLLNNLRSNDIMSFVARLFLFFQMTTVYPLLIYLFRFQFFYFFFGTSNPKIIGILILNLVLVALCVIFAKFLPHIGAIIRFSGAFCGLAYIFALPCIVYILSERQKGSLTWFKLIVHIAIIVLGVANVAGQFIIM